MTPRFNKLSVVVAALAVAALGACDANVPDVKGKDPVIPDRSPSRQVQALSSPSTSNTEGGSENEQQAFCNGGTQTIEQFNEDGSFVTEFDCAPGGGIDKIRNEGTFDEANGTGAYDQITTLEDGSSSVWHFTYTTTADFVSQTYNGVSEDGSESYTGTYTYVSATATEMHEVWNLSEGTYTIEGTLLSDGGFIGTTSFDDPATTQSPDWIVDQVNNADGSFSQEVHFVGDGFVSDYTYAVAVDGSVEYSFASDLLETSAEPDWVGAYSYDADGSGSGAYTQLFDDGSTLDVSDEIHLDGSLDESWEFDDAGTDQSVDQAGSMHWNADGSGEGSVTTFVVGGDSQTCEIHVDSEGNQSVDNCG